MTIESVRHAIYKDIIQSHSKVIHSELHLIIISYATQVTIITHPEYIFAHLIALLLQTSMRIFDLQ